MFGALAQMSWTLVRSGTGYNVVLGLEEAVALRDFNPLMILVHLANSSVRHMMAADLPRSTR